MAPIHDAVRAGDVEALRRELERGVSPDTDEYGMTPLFTAAHRNNANCIPLLLRAGADPNASMNGISALIMAASYGSRDAVCMLLEAGALVDVKTEWGWTAMDYAYTSRTFAAICPLLLRAGSELPRAGGSIRNDPYLSRPARAHPDRRRVLPARGILPLHRSPRDRADRDRMKARLEGT